MSQSEDDKALFSHIHEALTEVLLSDATDEGIAKLEPLLAANPRAQEIYLRYITETDILRAWGLSNAQDTSSIDLDVDPQAMLEILREAGVLDSQVQVESEPGALAAELLKIGEHPILSPPRSISTYAIPAAVFSIAAVLVLTLSLMLRPADQNDLVVSPNKSSRATVKRPQVATIIDTINAELTAFADTDEQVIAEETDRELMPSRQAPSLYNSGARLTTGRFKLTAGLVQLRFYSGAEAILEAPLEIILHGENRAELVQGKLVGRVPPKASGFTVETSLAKIVDLGTEFGVEASFEAKELQVHVFDGEVSLSSSSKSGEDLQAGRPISLVAGQAAVVDSKRDAIIKMVEHDLFTRRLPTTIKYVGVDEGAGRRLRSQAGTKPLDVDRDDLYGSAGYYFFNIKDIVAHKGYVPANANLLFEKPKFLKESLGFPDGLAASQGVFSVGGREEYLDMIDPRARSNGGASVIKSGVLTYPLDAENPQGAKAGSEVEICRLALGNNLPTSGLRLGVFTDNADLPETVPAEIRVRINDVEARVATQSRDLDGDIYLFDIQRAREGDVIEIHLRVTDKFASIGGITFDVP